MRTTILLPLAGLLLFGAAACGDSDPAETIAGDRIAAEKPADDAPGDTPVSEDPSEDPGSGDQFDSDHAREEARALLGMNETDLPEDVRISRRGDEQYMLTEDYVLGRRTVELDDTDGSGYRVVLVTVELPDGPETYELQGG